MSVSRLAMTAGRGYESGSAEVAGISCVPVDCPEGGPFLRLVILEATNAWAKRRRTFDEAVRQYWAIPGRSEASASQSLTDLSCCR